MAAHLELKVLVFAADGAAPELLAQEMMDQEQSDHPPLTYEYKLYGIFFKVPVFDTGPCISETNPPHTRKTSQNQLQYRTHTASMGNGVVTNRSLVDLFETNESGLVLKDVKNVDKQDDGAACHVFHTVALDACTVLQDGVHNIHEGFLGLFVYLFVFGAQFICCTLHRDINSLITSGTLFDAWLSHTMVVRDRVLCTFRARYWLHFWQQHIVSMSTLYPDLFSMKHSFISPASFHIFNTLILLAIAYSQHYLKQPFCPWLLGTEFVEHFFGLA